MADVQLTFIGHSCFLMNYKDYRIVVDPYKPNSVPGYSEADLEADAVYCSHEHGDHNGTEALRLTGKPLPNDIRVNSYSVPHDHHGGKKRGMNFIREFCFDDIRIVHFGDTGTIPKEEILAALKNADCILLPVGGFFTINSEEAYEIAKELNASVTVPMHYRTDLSGYGVISDCTQFLELAGGSRSEESTIKINKNCEKKTVALQPKNEEN